MSDLVKRPRVLVIAEAANPEWVSVPLVGWSLARALSEVADVHIVTQIRNREAILRAGLIEGEDFTAIDSEAITKPLWRTGEAMQMGAGKGWTTLQAVSALAYPYFERLVWKTFGPALERGDYDVVHRVTPLSPTHVSPIARKCARLGIPFVMGPLNGGVPWPKEFEAARRQEREWLSYFRGIYKKVPGRGAMVRSAAAIIAGSTHTASEFPAEAQERVVWLPENAVDAAKFDRVAGHAPGPLRVCYLGRMVPYKGPDMLLEAAEPLLRDGQMTLEYIGEGPMYDALREQAADVPGVTFHGWVKHAEVPAVMAQCSVLASPSVREFGGGVVLEAMALGVMPLIVNYAGPRELVTPQTARTVPLGDRASIVEGFRRELTKLAADPSQAARIGARAREVVMRDFTWGAKARQVREVYDWVLGARADKPAFAIGAMALDEGEDDNATHG